MQRIYKGISGHPPFYHGPEAYEVMVQIKQQIPTFRVDAEDARGALMQIYKESGDELIPMGEAARKSEMTHICAENIMSAGRASGLDIGLWSLAICI